MSAKVVYQKSHGSFVVRVDDHGDFHVEGSDCGEAWRIYRNYKLISKIPKESRNLRECDLELIDTVVHSIHINEHIKKLRAEGAEEKPASKQYAKAGGI